jgi:hypothetical protein
MTISSQRFSEEYAQGLVKNRVDMVKIITEILFLFVFRKEQLEDIQKLKNPHSKINLKKQIRGY